MARRFDIPQYYRSPVIGRLKIVRGEIDPRKGDLSPSVLQLGRLRFKLPRHFGFCFGVENAIEIAYRAVSENPGRRIYLLSEMIHNPAVNADLESRGVRFLRTSHGEEMIPFGDLTSEDVVIVPAFGTTVEISTRLKAIGVRLEAYNTTCPFVEKVWRRAEELGRRKYTIVIHGKQIHEETRATFSHAAVHAPSVVVLNLSEARKLARYVSGEGSKDAFISDFGGRVSEGFAFERDLLRIGVVNQTTMLASETQNIANVLRDAMRERFGEADLSEHFADTKDTLCYATYENQTAMQRLVDSGGDIALIVGGYNSSNTSHLAELCSERLPSFYIQDAGEILTAERIRHLDLCSGQVVERANWLPASRPLDVLIASGASCPDTLVESVIERVAEVCREPTNLSDAVERTLQAFRMAAS